MKIILDKEKHEYRKGDIIIPGVTTILQDVGIIQYNDFVTPDKGTRIHKIIQNYIEGTLNWEAISKEEIELIDTFDKLTKEYHFTECEKILHNKIYNYAGSCDYSDGQCIGELKTGKPEKWHLLQLAAYVWCSPNKMTGILIYIKEKKNPIRVYTMTELKEQFKVFLCALEVYNFKRNGK